MTAKMCSIHNYVNNKLVDKGLLLHHACMHVYTSMGVFRMVLLVLKHLVFMNINKGKLIAWLILSTSKQAIFGSVTLVL